MIQERKSSTHTQKKKKEWSAFYAEACHVKVNKSQFILCKFILQFGVNDNDRLAKTAALQMPFYLTHSPFGGKKIVHLE